MEAGLPIKVLLPFVIAILMFGIGMSLTLGNFVSLKSTQVKAQCPEVHGHWISRRTSASVWCYWPRALPARHRICLPTWPGVMWLCPSR